MAQPDTGVRGHGERGEGGPGLLTSGPGAAAMAVTQAAGDPGRMAATGAGDPGPIAATGGAGGLGGMAVTGAGDPGPIAATGGAGDPGGMAVTGAGDPGRLAATGAAGDLGSAGEVGAVDLGAGYLSAGDLDAGELDAGELDAGELDAGDPCSAGYGGQQQPVLPPGQYVPRTLPVLHYGPVPVFHHETWDLRILGATESGAEARLGWDDVAAMPVSEVVADFHCVTKFTVPGVCWQGILASEVLRRYPPAAGVTHVMIWADFGYSANIRITDFAADQTLLATHRDGDRLTPEHGYPLRLVVPHLYAWKSVKWIRALEYLTTDRRGFWEERGYHNTADPWREQRYSYQETQGEGPPL